MSGLVGWWRMHSWPGACRGRCMVKKKKRKKEDRANKDHVLWWFGESQGCRWEWAETNCKNLMKVSSLWLHGVAGSVSDDFYN